MDILPLDQQKKAILYAPKHLLWDILEEDQGWLKIFSVLPQEYYTQFLGRLRTIGTTNDDQVRNMAKVYVKNKVRLDHLQEAIALVWKPQDLEDSTSFLKEKGFLNRPLMPLNLQAEVKQVIAAASTVSAATKLRLARQANGASPKLNKPPEGASPEAIRLWNRVLRDPKRRDTILAPKGIEDQWALALKFWLSECARQDVPAYKSNASSSSLHAKTSLQRSVRELHNSLCYDGYTMSKPASRLLRKLFDQLCSDGYDLGAWTTVRPKKPKRP